MENINYKISILIPVYNVRNYILRCLKSVAAQTFTGALECIIVDDCGTDDSIEIAEKFVSEYKGRIEFRFLHHDHNRGLAAARNTAVEAATGEFVFHLDSDDWLEEIAIDHLVLLQRKTNADIVSGEAVRHCKTGSYVMEEPVYESSIEMVHQTIELNLNHVIWHRLIRHNLYINNSISAIEGMNVGEDHYTMPRLAYYAKSVATLKEVVYHYNCMNPNSYMVASKKKMNMTRYENNLASIDFLKNFFDGKDDFCNARLKQIKNEFYRSSLKKAAFLSDYVAYEKIAAESGLEYHFAKDQFVEKIRGFSVSVKKSLKTFGKKIIGTNLTKFLKGKLYSCLIVTFIINFRGL